MSARSGSYGENDKKRSRSLLGFLESGRLVLDYYTSLNVIFSSVIFSAVKYLNRYHSILKALLGRIFLPKQVK